jgi:glycosyltransferase involved in cell wall biosynthesis
MTPRVRAERQAVYCHNPSPFYRLRARDVVLEPRFALFVGLYGLLYRINLRANRFVVVQQDWLRREFKARFGLDNVVVAHPELPSVPAPGATTRSGKTVFLYPLHPRVFKNLEVIAVATRALRAAGVSAFEVQITIDGRENRYARHVARALQGLPEIRLMGRQPREAVFALYAAADCLLFPSKLETWGLPITEFKRFAKPMLVADARYAAETVGDYPQAAFFDPDDAARLADLMRSVIEKRFVPEPRETIRPADPYARNWDELFRILLSG